MHTVSTISPAVLAWFFPGASWFHHQLIPSSSAAPPAGFLDPRTVMAVWQLGNCAFPQVTLSFEGRIFFDAMVCFRVRQAIYCSG